MQNRLSKKQLEVIKILWDCNEPMIASDIVKSSPDLQINTVQACLKGLIKKEYIEVADIVYSGTVLTRSYRALVSKEEYFGHAYEDIMGDSSSSETLMASLIEEENNVDVLNKLEKLLQQKKKELEGK